MQFSEGLPITQASPFFANSDPDMPAAPVPASQILEWISQQITASLENAIEKEKGISPLKETSVPNVSGGSTDTDITMVDALPSNIGVNSNSSRGQLNTGSNPAYYRNQTFVEGFSKASVVKHPGDIKGHSIKVCNQGFENLLLLGVCIVVFFWYVYIIDCYSMQGIPNVIAQSLYQHFELFCKKHHFNF